MKRLYKRLIAIIGVIITFTGIAVMQKIGDTVDKANPTEVIKKVTDKVNKSVKKTPQPQEQNSFVEKLTGEEQSSTRDGAVKYGATFVMGDLDSLGRATSAHILVSDAQEPGTNGVKRDEKITVDPAGWGNYKINKKWANDRTHLVGWQFSGINNDTRNLVPATTYLNRGVEGTGMSQSNPDGMLYYEMQLDSWLATHPNFKLDLYVKPTYEGSGKTAKEVYMQWVGVDRNGQTIPIQIGGHSKTIKDDYMGVTLKNESPSYVVDYQTGQVKGK